MKLKVKKIFVVKYISFNISVTLFYTLYIFLYNFLKTFYTSCIFLYNFLKTCFYYNSMCNQAALRNIIYLILLLLKLCKLIVITLCYQLACYIYFIYYIISYYDRQCRALKIINFKIIYYFTYLYIAHIYYNILTRYKPWAYSRSYTFLYTILITIELSHYLTTLFNKLHKSGIISNETER